MIKYRYLFILLTGLFMLSSCGSKQMVAKKNKAGQLSQQLGFPVSHKDKNIDLYSECVQWLGVPYKYAGMNKSGVDCSGLVNLVYKNVYNIQLERNSENIYKKDCRKVSQRALKPGDLVFFDTKNKRRKVNHVGVFLKDNVFIHASTSQGVRLNKLDEKYFKQSFVKGGRVKK